MLIYHGSDTTIDSPKIIKSKRPLDFVRDNRMNKSLLEYDIVIGPVADEGVFKVISYYENGVWDKETTLRKIKSENLEDQIVFATEKSLKYIKFVEMEVQYHE